MNDYNAELDALAAEIAELVAGKAQHASHLHASDEAKADTQGHMRWCPGCRLILVTRRMAKLTSVMDDTSPRPQLKGKSRREAAIEEMKQRREIEREAPRAPQAGGGNRP